MTIYTKTVLTCRVFITLIVKMSPVDAYFDVHGFGNLKNSKDLIDTQPYQWGVLPKYQVGIARTTARNFMCSNINDADGPYHFELPNIPNQVIDGSSLRAVLLLQMETTAGNPAKQWNEVGPIPDIGNTMFDSVQIAINDQAFSELSQEHYPYKAYLEKLLKYDTEAHDTNLAAANARPDNSSALSNWVDMNSTENEIKVTDEVRSKNKNFWMRSAYALMNRDCKFTIDTELHLDIFQGGRYMPPGLKFDIVFHRNRAQFYIMTQDTEDTDLTAIDTQSYRIKVVDFRLEVNYITLEGPLKTMASQLRQLTVPFNKIVVHKTQFPTGYTTLHFDICRGGILPRQLLIGMVDTKDFHGQYKTTPFNFRHYKISEIGLIKNGERYPLEPLTMDFNNEHLHYATAYRHFLKHTGHGEGSKCQITMEVYPFGHTLFAFDLSKDLSNNFHLFPPENGSLSVEIKLKETYTSPITLLVLGCYSKLLTVRGGEIDIDDI